MPDFKCSNDKCSELSSAPRYYEAAKEAIRAMIAQGVPVIVRILVLPGHYACCHMPVLATLNLMNSEYLYVSINGQYWPDWKITSSDGMMASPAPPEEVQIVCDMAHDIGLQVIE